MNIRKCGKRRGVSHTPENIHMNKQVYSGRMQYAPTVESRVHPRKCIRDASLRSA